MNKLKLGSKLAIYFLLVVVVSVGTTGYLSYSLAKYNFESKIVSDLLIIAETKKNHISDFLDYSKGRVIDFSSDGFIRDSVRLINSGNTTVVEELNRHLVKNKMSLDQTIYGINVVDLKGKVIASTEASDIGIFEVAHDYFVNAKDLNYGEAFLSDVSLSHHFKGNVPCLAVSAPLIDKDTNEKLGVIINHISLEDLNNIISKGKNINIFPRLENNNENIEIYLVNKDGVIITKLRSLNNLILKRKIISDLPTKCISNRENNIYTNYMGEEVVGASSCFENGWTLLVEANKKRSFIFIEEIRIKIITITLLIVIGVLCLVYLIVIRITTPIKRIIQMTKGVSKGDLSQKMKIYSDDEIGELAASFNMMMKDLGQANKKLEDKIDELANFKSAINNASDLIIVTNTKGKISFVNEAIKNVTGHTKEEVYGKNIFELCKPTNEKHCMDSWMAMLSSKKSFIGETVSKKKSGKRFDAELRITPILDRNMEVKYCVVIERDVTTMKALERARNEFISLASHQLHSPSSIVKWYIEELLRDSKNFTPKQEKYLNKIYKGNERIIELNNSFLDVSRLDLGTFKNKPELVDVVKVTQIIIREFEQKIKEYNIDFSFKFTKNSKKIFIDKVIIRNILVNLIDNAIKYTQPKGKISVEIKEQANDLLIQIKDTGFGIPYNQQSEIFKKLFRADNIRVKHIDGTGLGLYIVKSMVGQSKGKIWFKSSEGIGSTFFVSFPLAID